MARPTRLAPAPLAFPSGGGLKAMGNKSDTKMKDLEHQILDLQNELNHHKVNKKYAPKPITPAKPATKRPMNNPNKIK